MNTLTYAELAEISHIIGANWLICQGNGGNTSKKNGNSLLIKASGYSLVDSLEQPEKVFVNIDITTLRPSSDQKPSMELPFHLAIKNTFVLHYHSQLFLILSIAGLVEEAAEMLSNLSINYAKIPYFSPGEELFNAIESHIGSCGSADVFMLQNHGIIVNGNNPEVCLNIINQTEDIFSKVLHKNGLDVNQLNSTFVNSKLNKTKLKEEIMLSDHESNYIRELVETLPENLYLFPDQVVYLPDTKNVLILLIKSCNSGRIKINRLLVESIITNSTSPEITYSYLCTIIYLLIGCKYICRNHNIKGIALSDVEKIKICPHESYRRSMKGS